MKVHNLTAEEHKELQKMVAEARDAYEAYEAVRVALENKEDSLKTRYDSGAMARFDYEGGYIVEGL